MAEIRAQDRMKIGEWKRDELEDGRVARGLMMMMVSNKLSGFQDWYEHGVFLVLSANKLSSIAWVYIVTNGSHSVTFGRAYGSIGRNEIQIVHGSLFGGKVGLLSRLSFCDGSGECGAMHERKNARMEDRVGHRTQSEAEGFVWRIGKRVLKNSGCYLMNGQDPSLAAGWRACCESLCFAQCVLLEKG